MMKYGIAALGLALLAALRACGRRLHQSDRRPRARVARRHSTCPPSTTLQVDSSTGVPGTVINGENQFGLDSSDFEPKFQVMVRAGERNRLRFDYFTLDRTGNATVAEPIVFRDARAAARRPAAVAAQPAPAQPHLRLFLLAQREARARGDAGHHRRRHSRRRPRCRPTPSARQSDAKTAAGPFPTPGIDATWVAEQALLFRRPRPIPGRLHVNNLDGSLGILELDALYRFRPNVSFALGYTDVKAHLSRPRQSNSAAFSISTPRGRSSSSGSRSRPARPASTWRARLRRKFDAVVRRRGPIPFAGGERLAARRIRVPGRERTGILQGDGDGARMSAGARRRPDWRMPATGAAARTGIPRTDCRPDRI